MINGKKIAETAKEKGEKYHKHVEENLLGKTQDEIEALVSTESKRGLLLHDWKYEKMKEKSEEFLARWKEDPTFNTILFEAEQPSISIADRIKQLQVEIGSLEDEIWTLKLLQLEEAKVNENNVETIIPQY